VLDAAMHRAEGRQEPRPGVVASLEHLAPVRVGDGLELLAQRRHGVVLVEDRVAQQEQAPLLGREQEHQPHHHGDGGLVELRLVDADEQRAARPRSMRSMVWMTPRRPAVPAAPSWSVTSCWLAALSLKSASSVVSSVTPKSRRAASRLRTRAA
jgi:hypothetical protein